MKPERIVITVSMLIEHFPSYMVGGGIFVHLDGMPWYEDVDDLTSLDIEYFGNHSGLKQSSALIEKMTCFKDDGQIDDVEMQRLVQIIKNKFLHSWVKMWDAIHMTYNPLDNYDMTETTTPRVVRTTKQNTDVETKDDASNDVYGFNSTNPVHDSKSGNTQITKGNANNNYTETSTTGEDVLIRRGNIGVMTSAQLLSGELEVRKQHFFDFVYDDIDTILTRKTWGCCK